MDLVELEDYEGYQEGLQALSFVGEVLDDSHSVVSLVLAKRGLCPL